MKWAKMLRSQAGESLTMALVAVGIASVVTLAVATSFIELIKGQNTQKAKNEIETFHRELYVHLSQKAACVNTFTASGPFADAGQTGTLTQIKDAEIPPTTPTVKFDLDTNYGSDTFRIDSLRYTYRDVPPLGTGAGEIELMVGYRILPQVVGPSVLRPKALLISTSKGVTSRALVTCMSKSSLGDSLWKITSSNANNIFYGAGAVGVQTDVPKTAFNVVETNANNPRGILSSQFSPDGGGAQLSFEKARGGPTAPAALLAGDVLGGLHWRGHTGGGFVASAIVQAFAEQNFSGAATGTGVRILTTPVNTASPIAAVTITGAGNTQIATNDNTGNPTLTIANTLGSAYLSFLKPGRRWNIGVDTNDGDKFKFAQTQTVPNFATDTKITIGPEGFLGIGTSATANNPLSIVNPTGNAAIKITSQTFNAQIRMDSAATGVTTFFGNGAFSGGASVGLGTLTGHPVDVYVGGVKKATFPYGGAYNFQVYGGMLADVYSNSDARLKADVRPLTDDLEKIDRLRGVTYRLKSDGPDGPRQMGLIAQNLEASYPEAVRENASGLKAVDYGRLVAPLIEAIRTLYARLTSFESKTDLRLRALADEVAELRADNARLRARISTLGHAPTR